MDAKGLGVREATVHPKATENMEEIESLIAGLVEKGYAYRAANGDVYFRTHKFDEYGKLSHQPLDDLESGARIAVGEEKEDPMVSPCGRRPSRESPAGPPPGATGGRAGISNAPPWPAGIWEKPSTSTAAARI